MSTEAGSTHSEWTGFDVVLTECRLMEKDVVSQQSVSCRRPQDFEREVEIIRARSSWNTGERRTEYRPNATGGSHSLTERR